MLFDHASAIVMALHSHTKQAHDLDLNVKNNIDMAAIATIIRALDTKSTVKRGTVLVDQGNEDLAGDNKVMLSVPADETWIVVEPWESIIFMDEHGDYIITLVLYFIHSSHFCR